MTFPQASMCHQPFNNLAIADDEAQWGAAVVGSVELAAVLGQGTSVVDGDLVALLGLAFALDGLGDIDRDLVGGEDSSGGGCQSGD
jgi:hypothetical protein